jgi:hypothetical protein
MPVLSHPLYLWSDLITINTRIQQGYSQSFWQEKLLLVHDSAKFSLDLYEKDLIISLYNYQMCYNPEGLLISWNTYSVAVCLACASYYSFNYTNF